MPQPQQRPQINQPHWSQPRPGYQQPTQRPSNNAGNNSGLSTTSGASNDLYSTRSNPPIAPSRQDIEASLSAYNELGPQWQGAVVDSFVTKMNSAMAQQWQQEEYYRQQNLVRERAERRARTQNLIITLLIAIPLTGIAATEAGWIGLVIAWVGIAAVSFGIGRSQRGGNNPRNGGPR